MPRCRPWNPTIASSRDATKLTVELLDLIRLRQDAVTAFLADLRRTLA